MNTYHITFGVKYATEPHPTFPNADPEGWLEIRGPGITEEQARGIAVALLGPHWAFCYRADRHDLKYYPHGAVAVVEITGFGGEQQ